MIVTTPFPENGQMKRLPSEAEATIDALLASGIALRNHPQAWADLHCLGVEYRATDRSRQPVDLPSSLRLGSSAAAPPGSLLLGVSSLSAVPIAATPPATTAAAAAFLAARLIFDRVPEDDFFFACDGALAFVDLFAFDLTRARFEDDFSLARLAVFFMISPATLVRRHPMRLPHPLRHGKHCAATRPAVGAGWPAARRGVWT